MERIRKNSIKKLILPFITTWMLLSGCGNNKWVKSSSKNTNNILNSWGKTSNYLIWQVKAWPVVNAKVIIEDIYWNKIYETETNKTWYYKLDKTKFENKLKEYWYDLNTELKVYTIGWEDIDINDDGVYWDSKSVNWSLVALLTWKEIQGSKINPITTLVSNYLLNILQDTSKKDEVAKKLGFKNYAEILKYDMEKQETNIEEEIRDKYLMHIYRGDENNYLIVQSVINSVLNNQKENNSIIENNDSIPKIENYINLDDYKKISIKKKNIQPIDLNLLQEIKSYEDKIKEIDEKIKKLSNNENNEEIRQLQQKLKELKNSLVVAYNQLGEVEKELVSNKPIEYKKMVLNKEVSGLSQLYKVYKIDISSNSINLSNINVETWKQAIDEKEQELLNNLKIYEEEKNKKYVKYQAKKLEYENIQEKYKNLLNGLRKYKQEYDNITTQIKEKEKQLDEWFFDKWLSLEEEYFVQLSRIQQNYNDVVDLTEVNFVNRWTYTKYYDGYKISYTQYYNKGNSYPVKIEAKLWDIWIGYIILQKVDYNQDTYNRTTFSVLEKLVKIYVRYHKIMDELKQLKQEADILKQKKQSLEYEVDNYLQRNQNKIDEYKKVKQEYEKAKQEYEIANEKYLQAKKKLENYRNHIEDFWLKVEEVRIQEQKLQQIQIEEPKYNLANLQEEKETYEETKKQLEKNNNISSFWNIKYCSNEKYMSNWEIKLWCNENAVKYDIDYMIKRSYEKITTVPYINGNEYGTELYIKYPFTIYVKYGAWDYKYPAKIWWEYKYDAYNERVFITKVYEVNSDEEVEQKMEELAQDIVERHDIMKNIIEWNYYEAENKLNEYKKKLQEEINQLEKVRQWNWDGFYEYSKITDDLDDKIWFYAKALIEYSLVTNSDFKQKFNEYVEERTKEKKQEMLDKWYKQIDEEKIKQEIIKWTKDGLVKATKDYLESYVELAETLLEPEKIWDWLVSIFDKVIHPVDTIQTMYLQVENLVNNLWKFIEKVKWLDGYEKAYWLSYGWSMLWFLLVDPGGKLQSVFGDRVVRLTERVSNTLKGLLYLEYRKFSRIYDFVGAQDKEFIKWLFLSEKYATIKNKVGLLHVLFGEWEYRTINWRKVRVLVWGLHSGKVVEELLRKGEIRVWYKDENLGRWREISYEEFRNLDNIENKKFKIVWVWQEVPSNPNRWPWDIKTLFPSDWTEEDITEAFMKAEKEVKKVLLEENWLPEYSPENAGKYWKDVKVDWKKVWEVRTRIKLENGKEIEIELWGRYDNEWKLDYSIQTFYPYSEKKWR